ncbi:hypothetical protein T07_5129 [Trichinella nelsoni]|uniref:Uncharacterized protein n=1 Tax=Trichinella nelsoni TaxID=6336 RepID=A0A0V0RX88_9BILA|nr:hypothetical protein T07_5129 [Trichinella nelsoni]
MQIFNNVQHLFPLISYQLIEHKINDIRIALLLIIFANALRSAMTVCIRLNRFTADFKAIKPRLFAKSINQPSTYENFNEYIARRAIIKACIHLCEM